MLLNITWKIGLQHIFTEPLNGRGDSFKKKIWLGKNYSILLV